MSNFLESEYKPYGYVEHQQIDCAGDRFSVADATATGPRPHDDLVWVGTTTGHGYWISPAEALELADAIAKVASGNLLRRGQQ